ncbi:Hypothetical protein I5071_020 (plasmid) [Sandaracinus amylolyticus]|nr:Hypothetical protein I5071_020 [Sandaracinus amylolyticus]
MLNHVYLRAQMPRELRSGPLAIGAIIFATLVYLVLAIVYLLVRYEVI